MYLALPQEIYLYPSSLNVTIQDNSTSVTFNCTADGALSYYWVKENDKIKTHGRMSAAKKAV